eukprot:1160811-Pelagomonas_calceolata.AAC.6
MHPGACFPHSHPHLCKGAQGGQRATGEDGAVRCAARIQKRACRVHAQDGQLHRLLTRSPCIPAPPCAPGVANKTAHGNDSEWGSRTTRLRRLPANAAPASLLSLVLMGSSGMTVCDSFKASHNQQV